MTVSVTGFPASDPIPAIRLNVLLGQGVRSPGTGVRACCMIGYRGYAEGGAAGGVAAGTATDKQIYAVYSAEEAAGYWGYGSNLYRTALSLFNAWRGITLYGISVPRGGSGGGVAGTHGTAAFVLGAGPVTAGSWTIYIGDAPAVTVTAVAAEAVDTFGARIESTIDAVTSLPVWFTYTAGTNTMDMFAKSPGADSTGIKYRIDCGTTGVTSDGGTTDSGALAAGTDGTEGAGAVGMWANTCDVIQASDIDFTYILPTSWTTGVVNASGGVADMIQDSCTADMGNKRMHMVVGHNGAVADALTFADTLDDDGVAVDEIGFRAQLAWASYNEAQPWEIAAAVLGMRAEAESSNINSNWCGFSGAVIPGSCGLHKCVSSANYPTTANLTSCLNGGVTPIKYNTDDDTLTIVRSVTCKHATGGADDYRTRDTNVAVVPDFVAAGLTASLQDEYDGFTITDDVDGAPPDNLGSYVTTPLLIRDSIQRLLKTDYELPGYICNVDTNATSLVVERNASNSQRVDAEIPVEVVRWLLQIGGNVREVGA